MIQIGIIIIVIGLTVFSIGVQRALDKKLEVAEGLKLETATLGGAWIEGRKGPVKIIIAIEKGIDE